MKTNTYIVAAINKAVDAEVEDHCGQSVHLGAITDGWGNDSILIGSWPVWDSELYDETEPKIDIICDELDSYVQALTQLKEAANLVRDRFKKEEEDVSGSVEK